MNETATTDTDTMCAKTGTFGWNELIVPDTQKAADFYSKLFGWKAERFVPEGSPADAPPYSIFKSDGMERGVGGLMQPMKAGVPAHWLAYVVVDNVDDSLARATKLGAKTLVPVRAIGEVGRIAVIEDPQGASLGLHELPADMHK